MSLRQRAYINQTADPLLQRFREQRDTVKQRGIPWQLEYWQWLEIWQTSGHLHERGEAQITKQRLRLERQATACSS